MTRQAFKHVGTTHSIWKIAFSLKVIIKYLNVLNYYMHVLMVCCLDTIISNIDYYTSHVKQKVIIV